MKYNTKDLVLIERKTKELESKLLCADWDDVVTIHQELENYRRKMEQGGYYEPEF